MTQAAVKHDTPLPMFTQSLAEADPAIDAVLKGELHRQQEQIELIASENYASPRVMEAQASSMMNKYAEGYPGKRYYAGCEFVDIAEQLAIDRAKELFKAGYANVQPHSGAQANQAVYFATLNPGDTILGMGLESGGHLTHGMRINISGRYYEAVAYGLDAKTEEIDYAEVEELARVRKPKMIIAGASAYSLVIDWKRFRHIADKVGALFMADIAHYAGLVAAGLYPSPVGIADFVTSTTQKTLRGPRGGLILSNVEHEKILNSAIFPGTQGGPHMHTIAAKAVAFKEAMSRDFRDYQEQVLDNARVMAKVLQERGYRIVSGRTDCHLFLVDLRAKGLTGREAETMLGAVGITINKNAVPNDPQKATVTSGIRIGSPAITTRGFTEIEAEQLSNLVADVLDARGAPNVTARVANAVSELCAKYPVYPA